LAVVAVGSSFRGDILDIDMVDSLLCEDMGLILSLEILEPIYIMPFYIMGF